ncbi:MAG: ATP-binding protein [Clostridia bacterium]|nr:ATP-binding protein [Clostridia bacterium]
MNEQLALCDCPRKTRVQLDVAAEEIFVNIAKYAYDGGKGSVMVRTQFTESPLCLHLTFIDKGKAFNPLRAKEPALDLPGNERQVGGLGIYIVKNSMDAVAYCYEDGQNRFTIQKTIR